MVPLNLIKRSGVGRSMMHMITMFRCTLYQTLADLHLIQVIIYRYSHCITQVVVSFNLFISILLLRRHR